MSKSLISKGFIWLALTALIGTGCGDSENPCPAGETKCGAVCVNTATDRNNCGGCGNVCLDGQTCTNSQCQACVNECTDGDRRCYAGSTTQYQVCGDPDNDTCKEWGPPESCGAGEVCSSGDCITGCEDECSRVGTQACDKDGANGFRVCGEYDADDCLDWGPLNTCGVGLLCEDGQCKPSCTPECDTQGATRCAPPPYNGIESCEDHDSDTCLEWGGLVPCQGGQTCDSQTTQCSANCQDDCTTGQRECEGNGYKTCGQNDADLCLDWSDVTNCQAWEVCNQGRCETNCVDACETGQRQCDGEQDVEMCGNWDADPCLEYGWIETCGDEEKCLNGQCVEDCKDECDPQGDRECRTDPQENPGFVVCGQNDADSCLEWSDITLCEGGQTCSSGICSDDCIDECAVDERECYQDGWHQCGEANDGDSCRDWLPLHSCESWEICDQGTVTCVTNCSNECSPALSQECDDDNSGYMICGDWNEDPCLEWSAVTECGAGQVCSPVVDDCVDDCEDECINTGDKQCADADTFETCGNWDSDSCLEYGNPEDCPANWVCSSGVCEETCQDECTTDSPPITVCEGTIGWRVCDYLDEDECLDLGSLNYCGGNEECQDGTCVVICTDECSIDEQYCEGNQVMACGDYDADPCLEMGVYDTCGAGTVCYKDWCVSDTPPVTVLINEILYDDESTDGEQVFIELFGPADLVLDNFSVVGINGSDQEEYVRVDLDGLVMPADGHFVIADTNTELDPAWVDLINGIADLQNGPDSVLVQWAGQVTVDALGYPGSGAGNIPVVEGSPAQDARYDGQLRCLSRGADHADTDDNSVDFLRRTMCTPGWEGPGAILWSKMVFGGVATPALDPSGYVYTVDSWGWPTKVDGNNPDADLVFNHPLPDSAIGQSSVALSWDGLTMYVGSTKGVYAIDPVLSDADNLVTKWGPVAQGCSVVATPNVDPVSSPLDGWIYFGVIGDEGNVDCPSHKFVAADANGVEQWSYPTNGAVIGSAVRIYGATEDYVVFAEDVDGSGNGRVVCLDAVDGSLVWDYPVAGVGCWGSVALGSDLTTVYVGCDDGMLYALDGIMGTIKSGFPVPVHDTVSATEMYVDGCSPAVAPGTDGMDYVFMTSRADAGNAYIYRDDGSLSVERTLLQANSSITIAADAFWLVHTGDQIQGFNLDGDKEWYAVLGDTHMTWITSSPTIAPGAIVYVLEFNDYNAFSGRLLAIQGSADLYTGSGGFPKIFGDWGNTGWGF